MKSTLAATLLACDSISSRARGSTGGMSSSGLAVRMLGDLKVKNKSKNNKYTHHEDGKLYLDQMIKIV